MATFVVPVHPHPLLAPEANEGYGRLRAAFDEAAKRIEASGADLLVIYSTTWPSIISTTEPLGISTTRPLGLASRNSLPSGSSTTKPLS